MLDEFHRVVVVDDDTACIEVHDPVLAGRQSH